MHTKVYLISYKAVRFAWFAFESNSLKIKPWNKYWFEEKKKKKKLGLSLCIDSYVKAVKEKSCPVAFAPEWRGYRDTAPIPPSVLAEVTAITGGQPGMMTYIKWLMISRSTWDRLRVLKWCEGSRPALFCLYVSDGEATRWSSCHLCFIAPLHRENAV